MVSALWKACADGNLENVLELLKDATNVDIEIKDHTGSTPLIEAVKSGNPEIVRALLEKGADPTNASSQGRPDTYTSDPTILELLQPSPKNEETSNGLPPQENGYSVEVNGGMGGGYYPPQAVPYMYYPPPTEGASYYAPHPPPPQHSRGQSNNSLPPALPPAVTQNIPCRYFPACRYGAACQFLHPQGPYYTNPAPPPTQYPGYYDPSMNQQHPYAHYYAVPQSFPPPPNGVHPQMSPQHGPQQTSPPPPIMHARAGSEHMIPPAQSHFSQPQVPYGAVPPVPQQYQGQVPVQHPMPPPAPHHQSPPPGPQSPRVMYNNQPPAHVPPFAVRRESVSQQYPPQQPPNGHVPYSDVNDGPKSAPLQSQGDGFPPNSYYRDGQGHARRGSARRPSFISRKPPCLFFPAGRCKNGDECRFPHIMPEGVVPPPQTGRPGQRPPRGASNSFGTLEDKMSGLSLRDRQNQSAFKVNPNLANGARSDRKPVKQRVPSADEFPVLAGSTTPPSRSPGEGGLYLHGQLGPTAAQILQAPAPLRRDSAVDSSTKESSTAESTTRVGSPESSKGSKLGDEPVVVSHKQQPAPISFAAVTIAGTEASKEISISA